MNFTIKFVLVATVAFTGATLSNIYLAHSKNWKMVFDVAKAEKEIADESNLFADALAKSDSVGVANFYTEDALSLSPRSII